MHRINCLWDRGWVCIQKLLVAGSWGFWPKSCLSERTLGERGVLLGHLVVTATSPDVVVCIVLDQKNTASGWLAKLDGRALRLCLDCVFTPIEDIELLSYAFVYSSSIYVCWARRSLWKSSCHATSCSDNLRIATSACLVLLQVRFLACLIEPVWCIEALHWFIGHRFSTFSCLIDLSSWCLIGVEWLTYKFRSLTSLILTMLGNRSAHHMTLGFNQRMLPVYFRIRNWLNPTWNLVWQGN